MTSDTTTHLPRCEGCDASVAEGEGSYLAEAAGYVHDDGKCTTIARLRRAADDTERCSVCSQPMYRKGGRLTHYVRCRTAVAR